LQALDSSGVDTNRLINNAVSLGAKCTRMDIALDIVGGTYTVKQFQTAVERKQAKTTSKTWRVMQGSGGGHTLYIGSRASERMVRVYDKNAQMAAKFSNEQGKWEGNWVRVEAEIKGDTAKNLLKSCADNDITDVLRSHLVSFIDFPTIPEYAKALSMDGAFVEPTPTKRKKTQTRHWLISTVAPTIAKEIAHDDSFWQELYREITELARLYRKTERKD
jgi:hypothetical protein